MAVASPDKDFMQLLRPGLILLRPPKKAAVVAAAAAVGSGAAPGGSWSTLETSALSGGGRISKFALVPYTEAHFREVCGQRWQMQLYLQHCHSRRAAWAGEAAAGVPLACAGI